MSTPTSVRVLGRKQMLDPDPPSVRQWRGESGTWLVRTARRHRLGEILLLLLSLAALISAFVLSCSP
jgi:hypothetical protein